MKYLIALLLLFWTWNLSAQQADSFTGKVSDQPRDPRSDRMNFVPNEVLVKFKDEVTLKAGTLLKSAGISAVDQILLANGAGSLEKLFPTAKRLKSAKFVKDPQGRDMQIPNLDNIYKIIIPQLKSAGSAPSDIFKFIEDLKALPEVEYAEPNYILSIDNLKPLGPVLSADNVAKLKNSKLKDATLVVVPNDPLFNQQGYLQTVKADLVWAQTMGDTTQVIAILDTGVDWNHPDLKNKIWRNKAEIPGNGIDDDGNGLVDDIRGWDYINNDNNPSDDNSHGTHVAGIAAAESNNGIGIAGVCPNAKILPIKVMSNKGTGDLATIVKGINYATSNGATVINMSIGLYAYSKTLEDALMNAYAKNILLVAAAGNDKHSIYDTDVLGNSLAFYPAAFSFVFGVQADGDYSNYDPDGAVYSITEDGINYELKAPGTALSTVPNGNYSVLTGTSMATPIISAALALYRSAFPQRSIEELWSDFIHSSDGIVDLNKIFFGTTKNAILDLMNFVVNDVNAGCDKDGKADAGEIVDVVVQIRNTGSPAGAVYAKIKQVDGDQKDITILKDSIFFGSIGVYRSLKNESNPFKVQINSNCYNNRIVTLEVSMCNNPEKILFTQKLNFKIFKGEELSGIIIHDTTFTADKNWVISNSLRISQGVTLTINPGTNIEILASVDNRGTVLAVGTPESRISMKGAIGGNAIYKNVNFDLNGGDLNAMKIDNCNISNANLIIVKNLCNSYIKNLNLGFNCDSVYRCKFDDALIFYKGNTILESVFNNFIIPENVFWFSGQLNLKYNVFNGVINSLSKSYANNPSVYLQHPSYLISYENNTENIYKNTFLSNGSASYFVKTSGSADMLTLLNQYWGTSDSKRIKKKYYDFSENAGLPYLNYEPKLTAPSDSCPGHVWKALVNGKDAQDENMEAVGLGKQRFDIFFNRSMEKSLIPQVSFGSIYPYTSNPINEGGLWSEDGRIYTVYKTIKLTTEDGNNRIRVAGAKQAGDWGWEIPIEDLRFNFLINAASSASMDFQAMSGLGKVKLEWNNNDLTDKMGFNMYRMEQINDSVLTKPVLINSTLIADTLYTDFAVTPNKKYYYYYKILRTNLSETDSSKVVSATPFTASKGDANGDLSVNVLDITTIVAYLLNNHPQPFITEAADYNSDSNINVLDIVGVVNFILNGGKKSGEIPVDQQLHLYLKNDTLFADAPVAIGGIQFDLSGTTSIEEIQKLKALEGFESGYAQQENSLRLLYFSMSGKTIPAGNQIPLLKLTKGTAISEAIFANKSGIPISFDFLVSEVGKIIENPKKLVAELGQNYPNPFSRLTTLPIRFYEPVDEAILRIFNLSGQELRVIKLPNPVVGEHLLQWDSGINKGLFVYKLVVRQGNKQIVCPVRKMIVQ